MMKAFASLTLEEQQKIYARILSALRTTTIRRKGKKSFKLQAIIYLSKLKIMIDAKFKNGSLKVNWEKLCRFILDIIYWQYCNVHVNGYVEGDETYIYQPYGPTTAPAGVHVDGTLSTDKDVNEFMGCIYEL